VFGIHVGKLTVDMIFKSFKLECSHCLQ